jgi:hypothetical protein
MGFQAFRQLRLEKASQENAEDHTRKGCDLSKKSSKDTLHKEEDHRANDKNIQNIHAIMFIKALERPSRSESRFSASSQILVVYEICASRLHKKEH